MALDGKTCLVTGAHRGIGLAIAQRLAQEPVRLLAGVRELDRYEPIAAAGATEVRPVRMDLSSRESITACLDGLGDELDSVDVLVNNAGEVTAGQLEEQDLDVIYELVQTNLLGPIHLVHEILPRMLRRGEGKIVNCSSIVGYVFFPGVTTYAASKSGLSGFTESLRREVADTPVTTLHVVTGGIETDMLDDAKRTLDPNFGGTSNWDQYTPEEWAQKVVKAIADDDEVLGPGGKSAVGKLASHLPKAVLDTLTAGAFERT